MDKKKKTIGMKKCYFKEEKNYVAPVGDRTPVSHAKEKEC